MFSLFHVLHFIFDTTLGPDNVFFNFVFFRDTVIICHCCSSNTYLRVLRAFLGSDVDPKIRNQVSKSRKIKIFEKV